MSRPCPKDLPPPPRPGSIGRKNCTQTQGLATPGWLCQEETAGRSNPGLRAAGPGAVLLQESARLERGSRPAPAWPPRPPRPRPEHTVCWCLESLAPNSKRREVQFKVKGTCVAVWVATASSCSLVPCPLAALGQPLPHAPSPLRPPVPQPTLCILFPPTPATSSLPPTPPPGVPVPRLRRPPPAARAWRRGRRRRCQSR